MMILNKQTRENKRYYAYSFEHAGQLWKKRCFGYTFLPEEAEQFTAKEVTQRGWPVLTQGNWTQIWESKPNEVAIEVGSLIAESVLTQLEHDRQVMLSGAIKLEFK